MKGLRKHTDLVHPIFDPSANREEFRCEECGRTVYNKTQIMYHRYRHKTGGLSGI